MPRDMIENERSSAIHTDESVEEKISLSDRFGLWIGFHNISQNDFINIIFKYCEKFKLPFNDNTEKEAIKWSLQRGNRTGRSAWQFIINYAAENNKKTNISNSSAEDIFGDEQTFPFVAGLGKNAAH